MAQPRDGNAEDWQEQALAVPIQLETAIKRKREKGYGKIYELVVYLNMSNYDGVVQQN